MIYIASSYCKCGHENVSTATNVKWYDKYSRALFKLYVLKQWKRFKFFFKISIDNEWSLRRSGNEFQNAAPETEKLRGPNVMVNVRETTRSPRAIERRLRRAGTSNVDWSISTGHGGALPCTHLQTRRPSLKSSLERIGSQCRWSRMSAKIG